jgi:cephalosporin hydroxylase
MEHFYQSIEGWFSYEDIYRAIVERAEDGDRFVEIGSFKGRSSAFMAVEIANSGKKIQFDCIDTWKGSVEHQEIDEVVNDTLYDTFLKNIDPVREYINPIRMTSLDAAELYEDKSINFIMIDGDHRFDAVCADIAAYLPKMKSGGIMTGDDAWANSEPWDAAVKMFGNDVDFPGIHFIHYVK